MFKKNFYLFNKNKKVEIYIKCFKPKNKINNNDIQSKNYKLKKI